MFQSCFLQALLLVLLILDSRSAPITPSSDMLALLAFKNLITEDPHGSLSSWNDSLHYCKWNGVICSRRHSYRVTVLDLSSQSIEGTLSPYISNLTFLATLTLSENNFHGPIPQELGHLLRLKFLNLSTNSFSGEIPSNISHCSNLKQIDLISNKLSGRIPTELASLSKLVQLALSKNEFHGNIPASLGNLSSFYALSLAYNSFRGSIPYDLCYIRNLSLLQLGVNNLTGEFPTCLYNLSSIYRLSFNDNDLRGTLPTSIGLTLPKLQRLFLGRNKFTGPIPASLSNASALAYVSLEMNALTGSVPRDLGKLKGLRRLYLHSNQLGTTSGDDLSFITSLTNCSILEMLEISNNSFIGPLPDSLGNFSSQMFHLALGLNQIHGSIPSGIENLVNLNALSIEFSHLTGEIPIAIGMLPQLQNLYLHGNQLSGQIPNCFNNLTLLSILNLSKNKLHGMIPPSLGSCQKLFAMDLSDNRLDGIIPKQVIGLSSLKLVLNLSSNDLSGSLPSSVGNLGTLETLDISNNNLSGHIPDTVGNCLTLAYLHMEGNNFGGKIPQSLSALKSLTELDLSSNRLSGQIPEYLRNFTFLTYLNLSHNELGGPVPEGGVFANASQVSVVGNSELCGGNVELKLFTCHMNKKGKTLAVKVIIIVAVLVGLSLGLLISFLMLYRRRMSRMNPSSPSSINHQYPKISYVELRKATNNFSADNLVGAGSYGSVYKGILDQDTAVVAVKVLNLQQHGASESFLRECNALKNLRHRNLVKIMTSCSSMDGQGNDFKALVFEYMPNGSLEEWLHPKLNAQDESVTNMGFQQRLNIAIDIASALDYLHHHCKPAIVHCDLKPSNVLLDDDMMAHVADFGLAKMFTPTSYSSSESQGSTRALRGSIGYVAPEYGMCNVMSTQGDVYSYGILMLEMFTGKRPTDSMFQNGLTLHSFAKMALPETVMDIVEVNMLLKESHEDVNTETGQDRIQKCLVSTLKVGVACSSESPMERMDMGEVITELCHIKENYQGGEAADFSYSGDTGPEKWGTLNPSFSACSYGKSQSPIDIPKQNVVSNPKLGPLSTTYNDATATLINNGFNVELLYENQVGHAIIDGKNYALKQIHWHSPSEHLIDGVSSAAELHLVHTSADGSISVIAILYKLGSPDPLLSQIKSEIDQLGKRAEGAKIPIQLVKIKDFMENAEKYFRYEGSLTSPPCTEKVIWNILTQVREISKEQVDAIKAPVDISSKNNARPVQRLNGREVVSSA